jgi:hypothetical protein
MAFQTGQVSAGTTATLVASIGAVPEKGLLVSSSATVYVGGSGVTTGTGFEVPATTPVLIPVSGAEDELALYAITSSGTATVSYIYG